jgi:hypothetical protein
MRDKPTSDKPAEDVGWLLLIALAVAALLYSFTVPAMPPPALRCEATYEVYDVNGNGRRDDGEIAHVTLGADCQGDDWE